MRLHHLILVAPLALGACAGTSALTATQTSLTDAQAVLSQANTVLDGYGIAKGIGLVAEAAYPALAPALSAAIARADPLVTQLKAADSAASLDLTAIQSLVAQISAQSTAITNQAAPVIKVIPATVPAAATP
jgi:hypothetical protein